jgi:hypothetical protein
MACSNLNRIPLERMDELALGGCRAASPHPPDVGSEHLVSRAVGSGERGEFVVIELEGERRDGVV